MMSTEPLMPGACSRLAALLLLTVVANVAVGEDFEVYPGQAFSDPDERVSMAPAWQAQPIRSERAAPGTDLIVTLDQDLYPGLLPLIRRFERDRSVGIQVSEGTCGISAGRWRPRPRISAGSAVPRARAIGFRV
jgi:hypothetical protein